MPRKQIKPDDRVKFSENDDGSFDFVVNGRIWAYDVDADDMTRTLKRFKAPLPCTVMVEDTTGWSKRQRFSR